MNKKPDNVIWITTDHMRYDCINANDNPAIHTPNLDFLVNNGVSFDRCYAQNPLCMPSRSSFMTGFYPQQVGVTENGECLAADFPYTAPRLFKGVGYQTAQIGKLHLQSHENMDLDPRARNDYGFDVLWLAEEPGPYEDAYVKYLRNEWREYVDMFRVPRSDSPQRREEIFGKVIDAPWQASFSGWVAEQGMRYLSGRDNSFLHMGFYAPHPPLNPTVEMFEHYKNAEIPLPRIYSGEWQDKPRPLSQMLRMCEDLDDEKLVEYRRHFYAMVTGVDMAIGQLLDFLRARGKLENTLIIFTSDHGDMCGDHRMLLKQHSFYDELMHLPLLYYWPQGLGTASRNISGMVEMIDILPTILGLCGGNPPPHMSGKDYSQQLLTGIEITGRDNVLAFSGPSCMMLRNQQYKYIRYNDGAEVLYDFADEFSEVINHATDPAYKDILHKMSSDALGRMICAASSAAAKKFRY